MDEPVGKVEVELAVEGNPEGREDEHCRVPRAREGLARRSRKMLFLNSQQIENLFVAEVRQAVGGVAVEEDRFPDGELDHAHGGVEHVVDHLGIRFGVCVTNESDIFQITLESLYRRLGKNGRSDHPKR